MTNSDTLYQPSVIELAQAGNSRAVAYWMNSLLAPQGIQVQVIPAPSGQFLKIVANFQQPRRREACLQLRDRLVRFICYRLWTLNSEAILGVQIVAHVAGDSKVLWQQSVRINTPANARKVRQMQAQRIQRQESSFGFQFMRSVLLSSVTLAGFYLGYRLFYIELSRLFTGRSPAPQPLASLAMSPGHQPVSMVQTQETLSRTNRSLLTVPPQFQGEVITHVAPTNGEKVVALTFDDGPSPEATGQILDTLKQYQIKATFFMVGTSLQRYPELARRVAEEGHAIGNHTWDHPLQDLSLADAASEIDGMEKLIYDTTGIKTGLFRPPGGRFEGGLAIYAKQRKYGIALWSVDSEDYYVAAPILLDNVLKNVQPGRIVLLHDGGGDRTATVQALPQIISALKQQGYRFVTVPELMAMQTEPPKTQSIQPLEINASAEQPQLNVSDESASPELGNPSGTADPGLVDRSSVPHVPTVPISAPTQLDTQAGV
jgi:peptidoglycan/xylan/chitin deacetylase (PgdA/CDA1 family)